MSWSRLRTGLPPSWLDLRLRDLRGSQAASSGGTEWPNRAWKRDGRHHVVASDMR